MIFESRPKEDEINSTRVDIGNSGIIQARSSPFHHQAQPGQIRRIQVKKMSWLEKLDRNLEARVSDEVRTEIMKGSDGLTSNSSPRRKAEWIQAAMERMDRLMTEEDRTTVMECCSCDFSVRKRTAREAWEDSSSIDDFIDRMNHHGNNPCNRLEREGSVLYSVKTGGCDCGWVRATKTPVSATFCHCGMALSPCVTRGGVLYCRCPGVVKR